MSALAVENASKHYAGAIALDGVSLSFPDGVITAVIGPSGCGKSTLLKLLNGLIRPDGGEVRVFGQPIAYGEIASLRRKMGYAVQGTGLFPHLSAEDNISLLAQLERWSETDVRQRLNELMALSQLDADILERFPHQLSGGQQQRVGLCRAMMLRPEVLLLDEPFAAIDPITRTDIHQQLLQLHSAEPTTSVLVTHDMREALVLAEQIVVMGAGTILCNESKADLLHRYPGRDPEALLHSLFQEAQT